MEPSLLIAYISFGSVLVPMLFAFANWRKVWLDFKPLCLILILSLAADLLSLFFIEYSLNTYIIGNLFLIIQFSLLVLVFRKQLPNPKAIDAILFLLVAFCILNYSIFQGPKVFNSVSNVLASLVLIGLSLFYFYRLLNDLPIVHIQHLPMLWISFAVLTYYAGNFFLFLINNYIINNVQSGPHKLMWILHNLLNITKNILFAVALWQSYRKVRPSTLSSSAPS
jgi:hypothetical protein